MQRKIMHFADTKYEAPQSENATRAKKGEK